jgi:predicted TIM-barrel fold metal-dependent hydrolase
VPDSQVPFVDTHVHFWDRPHPTLKWVWLEPDFIHPQLGEIQLLKDMKKYTADEFLADASASNVSKIVHVQAAIGSNDPVEETKWLQAMADSTGYPQAIVGDGRMQQDDVGSVIERHLAYPNFRGMRDFGEGDYLVDPAFRRGYALLEQHDLVYDLDVTWEDMEKAADLARSFPGVTLVVDHAGFPQNRTDEYFASWRKGLSAFNDVNNAVIKISGLGMGDQMAGGNWTTESIRPWVEACIEVFGINRSFFGSNWPVDKMYSTYGELISAYRELVSGFSEDEQKALFSVNAERVYRI